METDLFYGRFGIFFYLDHLKRVRFWKSNGFSSYPFLVVQVFYQKNGLNAFQNTFFVRLENGYRKFLSFALKWI